MPSCLLLATIGKHPAALSFLLSRGVWADSADAADDTAMHLAARAGSLPCVKALVKAGASTVLVNRRGLTALGEAAVMGHAAVMVWMAESEKESGRAAGWAVKDVQGRRWVCAWLAYDGKDFFLQAVGGFTHGWLHRDGCEGRQIKGSEQPK